MNAYLLTPNRSVTSCRRWSTTTLMQHDGFISRVVFGCHEDNRPHCLLTSHYLTPFIVRAISRPGHHMKTCATSSCLLPGQTLAQTNVKHETKSHLPLAVFLNCIATPTSVAGLCSARSQYRLVILVSTLRSRYRRPGPLRSYIVPPMHSK
jgi:hypothetical protein